MNVQLHINGNLVYSIAAEYGDAVRIATWIVEIFHVAMLKSYGVFAEVMITGVQSKMNDDDFVVKDDQ